MVRGIDAVWLPVNDMDRAVRFYRDTLGLKLKRQEADWAELDANGLRLGLNAKDSETPGPEGGAVLAFQPVHDLESTVDELRDKGVDVPGGISEHPWGRIAPLLDPDGNSLQLYEPPKS